MPLRSALPVTLRAVNLSQSVGWVLLAPLFLSAGAWALPSMPDVTQEQIEAGEYNLGQLRTMGEQVFSFPFTKVHGYGDGPMDPFDTLEPGGRPTMQGNPLGGNTTFTRVNGLDAQSCLECHSVQSSDTVPATFAVGGAGGISSAVLFQPPTIDIADQQNQGFASFDGRMINPPKVFGAGGIELIAKEMTRNLQKAAAWARYTPGKWYALNTHGVSFGMIRYLEGEDCTQTQDQSMEDRMQYWGVINSTLPAPNPEDGLCPDTSRIEGIDADLVVKPFGRKGTNFTTRDFDRGAMGFHFGIQPVEVVGEGVDDDGDGVINEISVGQMSTLAVFTTTLPRPVRQSMNQEAKQGAQLFKAVGCANCHRPALYSESRYLSLSHPEVPNDPDANVFMKIDMSQQPMNFRTSRRGKGLVVPMFSDLKRYDMGNGLMETLSSASDTENREFITARLWGVADTAPYLHDGRALTLHDAIHWHGGDAEEARDNYFGLTAEQKQQLLAFLGTLRNPPVNARAQSINRRLRALFSRSD